LIAARLPRLPSIAQRMLAKTGGAREELVRSITLGSDTPSR
jgi:hypothetical protein